MEKESKEQTQEEFQRWRSNFQNQICTSNTPIPQITIIGSLSKPMPQSTLEDDLNPEYTPSGLGIVTASRQGTQKLNTMCSAQDNGGASESQAKGLSSAITSNGSQMHGRNNASNQNQNASKKQKNSNKYNIGQQLEQARTSDQNQQNPQDFQDQNPSQMTEQQQKDEYQHKKKLMQNNKKPMTQHQMQQMQASSDKTGQITSIKQAGQKFINFELIHVDKYSITNNYQLPDDIHSILQEQQGLQYDFQNKSWVLGLETYKDVLIRIKQSVEKKNIEVYEIPQIAFDLIDNPIPFSSPHIRPIFKARIGQLPPQLIKKLYNFQKVGIQFGIDHYGRLLLGDEMGVGKTVQAIALSYLYQRDWPVLIISPSSLKYAWRDELMKWLEPRISMTEICVITKENQEFVSAEINFYIISYSLAWKMSELLAKLQFKVVIVDEAHYLKSRESKRSQHLLPIIMRSKRIMLLSGTPMLGRPNEIYNLLKILRPDVFRCFKEFGIRYCNPKETLYGVDWTGSSNMSELHLLLEKCLMIRRLKSEVLFELPAKRRQKIVVGVDERSQKKISKYLKQVKKWEYKIEEDFQELDKIDKIQACEVEDKYSYLLRAYSLTGMAKLKGVQNFIETLIDNRVKFLLFAHHYDVLDQLEDYIVKKQVSYIRIDGRIDNKKRHEAVKKYQTDQKCQVALLSLTASSQGITLTAASIVVFAEMNWTPGIMVQAEDRAHRIGQTSSVLVYYIYGEGTLDKLIYPRLQVKSEVISTIVDGQKKNQFMLESPRETEMTEQADLMLGKHRRDHHNGGMVIDPYGQQNQSDWSDEEDGVGPDGKRGNNRKRLKKNCGTAGMIESMNEDGMPIIPELMKYNDRFEDASKRKVKERQKIYDVFEKIKYGKQKQELQQTNKERSQALYTKLDDEMSGMTEFSSINLNVPVYDSQKNQTTTQPIVAIEEDNPNDEHYLPKPPLFPDWSEYQGQSHKSEGSEDDKIEENLNQNKWKMFNQLRQKKKQILKEQNPYQTIKIPPPPPMKQMGMFNRRRRMKFKHWLRRRRYYKGKTLRLVGSQDHNKTETEISKVVQDTTQYLKNYANTQKINTMSMMCGGQTQMTMTVIEPDDEEKQNQKQQKLLEDKFNKHDDSLISYEMLRSSTVNQNGVSSPKQRDSFVEYKEMNTAANSTTKEQKLSQSMISKFEIMNEEVFDDILSTIDMSQIIEQNQKSQKSSHLNQAIQKSIKNRENKANNPGECSGGNANNNNQSQQSLNKNKNPMLSNQSQKAITNKLMMVNRLSRPMLSSNNITIGGSGGNTTGHEQSISINIARKPIRHRKPKVVKQVIIKPYYDYVSGIHSSYTQMLTCNQEDDEVDLKQFIGKFDKHEPSFGYPLPNFFESTKDNGNEGFQDDIILEKLHSLSPMRSQSVQQYRESKSNWQVIRERLDPLRESVKKAKRTDDAFALIYKSFTYGKKLQRMRMSKLMKEKLAREQEERRIKEEEVRMLHLLIHKKSKSIGGTKNIIKHQYVLKDEQTGMIDFDFDPDEIPQPKFVTYKSHRNFTYFRKGEWADEKFDITTINEEQIKQMKELAAQREKERQEEAARLSLLASQKQSGRQSQVEQEEEYYFHRDSFALDYNPDYEKEISQMGTLIGGESVSIQNLTKKALAKLSTSSKSKGKKKKKKKSTTNNSRSPPGRVASSQMGNDLTSMISFKSKSTLRDASKKQQVKIMVQSKISNNQTSQSITDNQGQGESINNFADSFSTSSKLYSQMTTSQMNDASKNSPERSVSNQNFPIRNSRSYSNNRMSQRIIELKIKEFKDKLSKDQIHYLYERSFKVKDMPGLIRNKPVDKIDNIEKYNVRDWREIINQYEIIQYEIQSNAPNKSKTLPNKKPKLQPKTIKELEGHQLDLYGLIQSQISVKQMTMPLMNLRNRFQLVSNRLEQKAVDINSTLNKTQLKSLREFKPNHDLKHFSSNLTGRNNAQGFNSTINTYDASKYFSQPYENIETFDQNSLESSTGQFNGSRGQVGYINYNKSTDIKVLQTPSFSRAKFDMSKLNQALNEQDSIQKIMVYQEQRPGTSLSRSRFNNSLSGRNFIGSTRNGFYNQKLQNASHRAQSNKKSLNLNSTCIYI
ncbi:snf2 family n-terminal domain containing protein [Stylonychia lemnae]|uniref:Snf2 family n-terminal domain containing protein n=1 Tax=Stylonychia lemnae TaxID=5949 RepID=A0A077ZTQ0_STYLE|nr:snf2 family n-terminal domain containing protein [Stylonychia lemnae]|eukprot:CDW72909.1 snf2 family n-terminal domain containing protein [Stylonychia lemnae]